MRQLFLSQYKHRHNPILITYQNNYHKFTFIENDFNYIMKKKQIVRDYQINAIGGFIELVDKYKQNIVEIQSCDFKQNDLDIVGELNANTYSKKKYCVVNKNNNSWQQHNIAVIRQLSQQFTIMCHSLCHSVQKTTLSTTISTLTHFNFLQLRAWQRLISFISSYYKSSPLHQRLILISGISQYMKKFQFSFNNTNNNKKPAFKFMYPQSYIIDLVDFRQLFKSLDMEDDFVKQNDSVEVEKIKLMILENFIYLIMKSTKKADMNIYLVKQYFAKRSNQMIKIAQNHMSSELHSKLLYNIYFIYSYLNYDNEEFYEKIQRSYFEMLKSKFKCDDERIETNNIHKQSKQINKLLSVWKLNQRHNPNLYNQLVRPFLLHLLQSNQQKMYYSNIAINLLTAGITDIEVFDKIILSWQNNNIKDDQFMHMLKHYLNVRAATLTYKTDYHRCQCYQNPNIISYLHHKSHTIYSQCLLPTQQSLLKNISNRSKSVKKSSQHHRTQRIWSDIIKSIFQPKYQVIENANICNYEIDFLILTDKRIYAIQIQGGHYNKKDFNSQETRSSDNNSQEINNSKTKTTGKREIREIILKAYNIQFVKIHCEQKLPTYIMQSRNIPAGKKYIVEKIFNTTNVRVEDI